MTTIGNFNGSVDPAECLLQIGGIILKEDISPMVDKIKNMGGESRFRAMISKDLEEEIALSGDFIFAFHDMNYAEMPEDLKNFLFEKNLSYSWSWTPGISYKEGVFLYDGKLKVYTKWHTCGGVIYITATDIFEYGRTKNFIRWFLFTENLKAIVPSSNHEAIIMMKDTPNGKGFLPTSEEIREEISKRIKNGDARTKFLFDPNSI